MPYPLYQLLGLAIEDYAMISPGDRILVGISGGMDSAALLLLLSERLKFMPGTFELYPVLVDNWNGENPEHTARIARLGEQLGRLTGLQLETIAIPAVRDLGGDEYKRRDLCYHCAQKRRDVMIRRALELGCTRMALGHHKDDIVETSLMNIFYQRELSSMLPRLPLFGGRLDLIRPLAYIEKPRIEEYIYNRQEQLSLFGEVCPSKMARRDHRRLEVRRLTAALSEKIPGLKNNIFAALRNPKPDYLLNHLYQPISGGKGRRP